MGTGGIPLSPRRPPGGGTRKGTTAGPVVIGATERETLSRRDPDAGSGTTMARAEPVFEMVVLGSGGGPLETDCSGYLLKPYASRWTDGILGLEGGSGMGALVNLLSHRAAADLFPNLEIPLTHNTPVLRSAYIFSFLTCYLITHAHLDHVLSLIMLTGSIPARIATHPQPPLSSLPVAMAPTNLNATSGPAAPRPPVYGTRGTLERLAAAYGGGLWPELGSWAKEGGGRESVTAAVKASTPGQRRSPRNRGPVEDINKAAGVVFSPLEPCTVHRPLNPSMPITTLTFPVAHGCTSHGLYESSAMFIRYDPSALTQSRAQDVVMDMDIDVDSSSPKGDAARGAMREFLFFGDVESDWRKAGEEHKFVEEGNSAKAMCDAIWKEAAQSWDEGRLAGIFIECSYDSARPAHLMFGHVSPPGVYHELGKLAARVGRTSDGPPLAGLRVFITHIKESLVPHPTGKTAREIIMAELRELETQRGLGVEFVEVKRGDRILI